MNVTAPNGQNFTNFGLTISGMPVTLSTLTAIYTGFMVQQVGSGCSISLYTSATVYARYTASSATRNDVELLVFSPTGQYITNIDYYIGATVVPRVGTMYTTDPTLFPYRYAAPLSSMVTQWSATKYNLLTSSAQYFILHMTSCTPL